VPENAQTQNGKIVDSGTRRSRVGYLAFNKERKREDGKACTIQTISIQHIPLNTIYTYFTLLY